IEHTFRDADFGDPRLAAQLSPRQEQMSWLQAKERHRGGGTNGNTAHSASGAVDPARHIHGDDRKAIRIQSVDQYGVLALDGSRQTRTKQGVDHDHGSRQKLWRERLDGAGPALGHRRRIRWQVARISLEAEADRVTFVEQMASGNEAVAAIVAGP